MLTRLWTARKLWLNQTESSKGTGLSEEERPVLTMPESAYSLKSTVKPTLWILCLLDKIDNGTSEQKSHVGKFKKQLSQRCGQLGIILNRNTVFGPQFEPMHLLSNVKLLESKLIKIQRAAMNNLQLLICIMEKKSKGYADLKRIADTGIGVVSQL